jgi:hypothetical protein
MDIIVNNGVNSFDFESVAQGGPPSNQVSPAGSNASSGIAAHPSIPANPWCKWINKDGSPAGGYRESKQQ